MTHSGKHATIESTHSLSHTVQTSSRGENSAVFEYDIRHDIISWLDLPDLLNWSLVSKEHREAAQKFIGHRFKDMLPKEITASVMRFVQAIFPAGSANRALHSAAQKMTTMRISITWSPNDDQVALLIAFLENCFPVDRHSQIRRPLVVVTLFRSDDFGRSPQNSSALGHEPSHQQVLSPEDYGKILDVASDRGIPLAFNVHIPHQPSPSWKRILMHAIGVEIRIEDCQIAGAEVISSVRSLTLHVTSSQYSHQEFTFNNVAAQFLNVDDLQLVIDRGSNTSHPHHLGSKLSSFKELTSLSLEVQLHDALDLTMLSKLLTFSIRSNGLQHTLQLPQSIQRVILETDLRGYYHISHHTLQSLSQLRSVELCGFDLSSHLNLLQLFAGSLLSLVIRSCLVPGTIGKPHKQLKELGLAFTQVNQVDLSAPRLDMLACVWQMQTGLHVDQLKVLFLSSYGRPQAEFKSFKQFRSLTELWLPATLLTKQAIKDEGILDVFPSTLEILVLSQVGTNSKCWNFKPLKHLRSLGLASPNFKIESSRLPNHLHVIAVHEQLVTDLRKELRNAKRMTRVATITLADWLRGPQKGRFLSTYSEGYPDYGLDSLQNRRHDRDAWHDQLHEWNPEAHSSHHATTAR